MQLEFGASLLSISYAECTELIRVHTEAWNFTSLWLRLAYWQLC